jgi:hypothetical protein
MFACVIIRDHPWDAGTRHTVAAAEIADEVPVI